MNEIAVTTVTRNATMDDLTLSDYRDISEELRNDGRLKAIVAGETGKSPNPDQPLSLDNFVKAAKSQFSKAQWGKWFSGEASTAPPVPPYTIINRAMRNELRALVNLPALPPTIAEAISVASPDAEVLRIGDETPDRLIMVGLPSETAVTIHANGSVTAVAEAHPKGCVTEVTSPKMGRIKVKREMFDRLNARRVELGLSWEEMIGRLEASL